ncbi:peptide-methionine (R)-S-oxide reductase MsrB [Burkholderiales bacterium]|nr:peptide-methionine (R)-S-oxide reductase MsrB [Burkholderiales bacterium]
MKKIDKTNEQWEAELTVTEYQILRQEGTEPSFSHPLNKEYRKGIFACVACSTPLFTSEMKFESGTGWPSFFKCIDGAFEEKTDRKFFMSRTEYHCTNCGGHHGHVFPDGPQPTGLRYCNNGTALKFIPEDE